MATITRTIPNEPWQHKKGDDVYLVIEAFKEDDTPFDISGMSLQWDISDSDGVLVSILTTMDNGEFLVDEPAASFADMPLIGDYTHRLYDLTTNQTLVEGKFSLV